MARSYREPTRYSKAVVEKAWDYVNGGHKIAGDLVPTKGGLARHMPCAKRTLDLWEVWHPDTFGVIMPALMDEQERLLVNGGLAGVFSSTITGKMMCRHGYTERREVDNTSSDGSMSPKPAVSFDPAVLSTQALEELLAAKRND